MGSFLRLWVFDEDDDVTETPVKLDRRVGWHHSETMLGFFRETSCTTDVLFEILSPY